MLRSLKQCCLILLLCISCAWADGISINKTEVRLGEDGYYLAGHYEIELSFPVQQALMRGVPLYFVSEFAINRSRWYWLDDMVFHQAQTFKLSYNVLTRQYRITRGSLYRNFPTLEDAIATLAVQNSGAIPVDILRKSNGYVARLINKDGTFTASARLRLDTEQLPKLMQVNAMTNAEWNLDSDVYLWQIRASDLNKGKAE